MRPPDSIKTRKRIEKTGFSAGDIIVVKVIYSDESGSKSRPVLVLSSLKHNQNREDLLVAKISSSMNMCCWNVFIRADQMTGLRKPSSVVCDYITVVSKASARIIGRLDQRTLTEVKRKISRLIGL